MSKLRLPRVFRARRTKINDLKALTSRCERHVLHSGLGHVFMYFYLVFVFCSFYNVDKRTIIYVRLKERIGLSDGIYRDGDDGHAILSNSSSRPILFIL